MKSIISLIYVISLAITSFLGPDNKHLSPQTGIAVDIIQEKSFNTSRCTISGNGCGPTTIAVFSENGVLQASFAATDDASFCWSFDTTNWQHGTYNIVVASSVSECQVKETLILSCC